MYSSGASGVADLVGRPGGRQLHQYTGDTPRTHGGVTVNIDRDFLDVRAAG